MRPTTIIAVLGTGTEVGKTYVGCAVIAELCSQGVRVIARKPAQSFLADDPTTDAQELARATGEVASVVCPTHRWYTVAMAPPMAAAVLGLPEFTVADLADEIIDSWPDDAVDIAFVEAAGGTWSPQASDGLHSGDLAAAVGADAVLLVADAGLGVIHGVRAASAAVESLYRPVVVMLNRFNPDDELHRLNRIWLQDSDGIVVTTTAAEAAAALLAL